MPTNQCNLSTFYLDISLNIEEQSLLKSDYTQNVLLTLKMK